MRSLALLVVCAACSSSPRERAPIDAAIPSVAYVVEKARPCRETPVETPPRVDAPDEPWIYADVTRDHAPPPAALVAPMTYPLRAQDKEALCALDPRALDAFDRMSAADRADAVRDDYLDSCGEDQMTAWFCDDAKAIADGPERPARAFVKASFELSCGEDRFANATQVPGARVLGFDTEMPHSTVHLAQQLVRLCAIDARFAEHEAERDRPVFPIDAWVGDVHLRAQAHVLDDWYDVRAVVGLVNEVARTAGSDCRLIVLPSDGQEAFVAGGPGAGLVEALRAGLVQLGDPDAARRAGVAVE